LDLKSFGQKSFNIFDGYGFNDDNTMGMVSVCRDEITDPMYDLVIQYWGKTFNCCGLAGFVMMGKTGLEASTAHTPYDKDGLRRFVFYAFPHIAISEEGVIGEVRREGIDHSSHACGALIKIMNELKDKKINLVTDLLDMEQSFIRQKILSNIEYGSVPDLVGITKLACEIITNDIKNLLNTLNHEKFKYGLITGVQIHGPHDTTFVYPHKCFVFGPNGLNDEVPFN